MLVLGLMVAMVALVSSSTCPCPRSSWAGVVHRAQPQVEAGPGLAVHGAELQASLPPCTPDPGESGEEAEGLPPVGVLHGGGGQGDPISGLAILAPVILK